MFANFSLIDAAIVLLYFGVVIAIGLVQSRRNKNTAEFISGNREMPWPAVLGSIVATEVSAATFLATPGVGYAENMNYLQFGIGSFLARIMIAFVFVGAFYAVNSLTIYDFLAKRFGNSTRYTATLFFIVTRLLASAVRLMIAATGLSLILDLPFWACLGIFTLIAILYTGGGGIRGIIWTDVLQAVVFISCGLLLVAYITNAIGWSTILEIGAENGRFEIFRMEPESSQGWAWLNDSKFFLIAAIFGFVSTAAAFGTDQDMTQRMLTCKDVRSARRSVILSGFISIPIAALFLFIGVALFAFYQVHGTSGLPSKELADGSIEVLSDKVFPTFIASELPSGLRGLLLVGVLAAAMSSLDSTMGALSSSALVDLYRPIMRREMDERKSLALSRIFVAVFGLILALVAYALKDAEGFLWLTFQIASVTYGALLGIFLLGILTKRGCDRGNLIAMLSAALICASLLAMIKTGLIQLGWTWLILIGTGWTILIGALWHEKAPGPEVHGAEK
ncbi:MAG: sodium/solute symporter [Verrucomicrobiota bacterium]